MNQLQRYFVYVINNVRKKTRALRTRTESWREKRKKTTFLTLNHVSTRRLSLTRLRFDGALELSSPQILRLAKMLKRLTLESLKLGVIWNKF